jgi:hypothetical protein
MTFMWRTYKCGLFEQRISTSRLPSTIMHAPCGSCSSVRATSPLARYRTSMRLRAFLVSLRVLRFHVGPRRKCTTSRFPCVQSCTPSGHCVAVASHFPLCLLNFLQQRYRVGCSAKHVACGTK